MSEGGLSGGFGDGLDLPRLRSSLTAWTLFESLDGPLLFATRPFAEPDSCGTGRTICLIDGRPGTGSLAAALGTPPHSAATELLARGFERFGGDVLDHLDGGFAVAIWDREQRRGLLARDRLGQRPLFLCERAGSLLFASEVAELAALLPRHPPPDEVALAHWLARRPLPGDRTMFEGISRLPAAHIVELRAGGALRPRRWWQPRYREPARRGRQEAAAALRTEMAAAVTRAVAGSRSPGLLLSGGFDSGAIAALSPEVPAYSRTFPGHPEIDESERIGAIGERRSARSRWAPFRGGSALASTAEFIAEWSLPPVTPNGFIWSGLLADAAGDGVDVLLDGEGGDELFGCSPALLADLLRRGRLAAMYSTARALPGMTAEPRRRWVARAIREYGVRPALPAALHGAARRLRRADRSARPWLTRQANDLVVAGEDPDGWKRRPGPRWWARLADSLLEAPERLGATDQLRRESAQAGLEFGHPWRDPGLIDHVLRTDPALAFAPDIDRPLARSAMQGLMPDQVRLSTAKPHFNQLLTEALAGPDRHLVEDLVRKPPDAVARHLNSTEVDRLLRSPPTVAWPLDVWRLASASAWIRWLEEPRSLDRVLV